MTELISHNCIKPNCSNTYQDKDIDAYYCPTCLEEKQRLAKEIDSRPKPEKVRIQSDLEIYNQVSSQTGNRFINARDLGIF